MALRSRTDILADLKTLTADLAGQRVEMAMLLRAELDCKVQTWASAVEIDTVSGRDRMAEFNAVNLTGDIITLKGEIVANEDRRVLLLEELHYAPVSD